jgi:hypothetical protein
MEETYLTVCFEPLLAEKVIRLAKAEKRSIADQAAYLLERGLQVLEEERVAKMKRAGSRADQSYSLPGLE